MITRREVRLLALCYLIFARFLRPLPATNLLVAVAFGYFVFKAGYTQAELLFYFLFFAAFVLMLVVIALRPQGLFTRGAGQRL